MLKLSPSISTKTGSAPKYRITSAVAVNVWTVVMTLSPGPTPRASKAKWSPAVAEFTASA